MICSSAAKGEFPGGAPPGGRRRAPCRSSRWRRRRGASSRPGARRHRSSAPPSPVKVSEMVSSGRPADPCRRLISAPSSVPTVRSTLVIGISMETGVPSATAGARRPGRRGRAPSPARGPGAASGAGPRRQARPARPGPWRGRGPPPSSGSRRRRCRAGRRGRWPRPASAGRATPGSSRTSSAMYSKNVSTNSGLPLNLARRAGFCVAIPTGQVSRWQTRIMMQPETTSGAEAKPYSSAPRRAPMMTSRPVFIWPSTWTTMRSRSPLTSSVCWVSASPISQGMPACFSEVSAPRRSRHRGRRSAPHRSVPWPRRPPPCPHPPRRPASRGRGPAGWTT